jgi:putative addiction module component (TIGR02574 family)
MTDLVAQLFAQAKALTPEARTRLAEELLASLDPHDPELEAAWNGELRRRIDEVERSTSQLIPADHTYAQVRRQRQRVANTLTSLRANRIALDGSLKDWISRGRA